MEQTTLPVEVSAYTDDQLKAARNAILAWQAGPVNPLGVSLSLNQAIAAEYRATGQMHDSGPAAVLMNYALQNIINRNNSIQAYTLDELTNALDECCKRVAGTQYEWPKPTE